MTFNGDSKTLLGTQRGKGVSKGSKKQINLDKYGSPHLNKISPMIEYKVLKELENNPFHTQRTLAENLGISLGKVNYVLGGLIDKGIVKAKKMHNDPGSIRWKYILTPKGIKEKVKITTDFLNRRLIEFNKIKKEIEELEKEIKKKIKTRSGKEKE